MCSEVKMSKKVRLECIHRVKLARKCHYKINRNERFIFILCIYNFYLASCHIWFFTEKKQAITPVFLFFRTCVKFLRWLKVGTQNVKKVRLDVKLDRNCQQSN